MFPVMGPPLPLWATRSSVSPPSQQKLLPCIQSKSILPWFKAVTPCPITTGPAENIFPIFPIGPLQVLEGCYKVCPEPSLLGWAGWESWGCPHRRGAPALGSFLQPPLDPLWQLHVLPVLGAPELDIGPWVGSHQSGVDHRMLGVGRDLCGSSSPTPLPNQTAQDLVQAGLEYLQRRRLHNLPRQPVPVLRHPQREEVLPHVQMELPMLQFVPIAPCPIAGHHWQESGPILLTPTLKIFIGIYKVPSQSSLLQAEQVQLTQLFLVGEMIQSLNHLCSPPLDSLQ